MAKKQYSYIRKTFTATLPDGSKKQIQVYGRNEKEALKKLAKVQAEYELGIRTINSSTPFRIWCEEWLNTYRRASVAPPQFKDLSSRINKYFVLPLGEMSLSTIKPVHIQQCLNALEGKSKSFQKKCYNDINGLFKKAVENELVIKNPVVGTILPQGKEEEPRRALTPLELDIYRKVSAQTPYALMFDLSLDCGLRPQEVRALRWENIDIEKAILTVAGAIKKGTRDVGEPKSKAGLRRIPIPNILLNRLKELDTPRQGFIFASGSGSPVSVTHYKRKWKSFHRLMDIEAGATVYRNKIMAHAIDVNLSPYYLRHTYATSLAEKGVPMKTAQVLLGHSSISITAKVYTHFTEAMFEDARKKIDS